MWKTRTVLSTSNEIGSKKDKTKDERVKPRNQEDLIVNAITLKQTEQFLFDLNTQGSELWKMKLRMQARSPNCVQWRSYFTALSSS